MSASKKAIKEQEKKKNDLRAARNDKCVPIVEKIFELIVDDCPTVDMTDQKKAYDEYNASVGKILQIMKDANLTFDEGEYVQRLCSSRMELLMTTVEKSMEINRMDMQEKVFGKPIGKLTFDEVDGYLKNGV